MHVGAASQAALLAGQTPVTYLIFDLLQLDCLPLMDLEYTERRALLDELLCPGPNWQTPPRSQARTSRPCRPSPRSTAWKA